MIIEEKWYVGQTRAGLGTWAEKNLAAQADVIAEVYSPRIVGPDGEPGSNLFSRYIFLRTYEHPRAFAIVNSTRGMDKLLPLYSEFPLSVPADYVQGLKIRIGEMGRLEDAEELTYDYCKDQGIAIVCGDWAGSGSFQYRKKNLAMILMTMMGRQRLVGVPLQNTRPLVSALAAC